MIKALSLTGDESYDDTEVIACVLGKASSIVNHVYKYIHAPELFESEKHPRTTNATMIRPILNIPDIKLRSVDIPYKLTSYDRNMLKG